MKKLLTIFALTASGIFSSCNHKAEKHANYNKPTPAFWETDSAKKADTQNMDSLMLIGQDSIRAANPFYSP